MNGIDDLRLLSYRQGGPIPAFGSEETIEELKNRFPYLFPEGGHPLYKPIVKAECIDYDKYCSELRAGEIDFSVFGQDHGPSGKTLGVRVGDTAYSPDMVDMNETSIKHLKGIKNWIVDGSGYRRRNHPVHASLYKIFELNELIEAERVILTHLPKEMDYNTLAQELPAGYEPAFDGLRIEISYRSHSS